MADIRTVLNGHKESIKIQHASCSKQCLAIENPTGKRYTIDNPIDKGRPAHEYSQTSQIHE